MSADTLRTAVDFAYSGVLPADLPLRPLAALLRAAHRLLMPQLLAACRVRLAGVIAPGGGDEALFEVYEAAAEVGDEKTSGLVRRFLLGTEQGRRWVESLVADAETWDRIVAASAAAAAASAPAAAAAASVVGAEGGEVAAPAAAAAAPAAAAAGGGDDGLAQEQARLRAGAMLLRELTVRLLRGEGPAGAAAAGPSAQEAEHKKRKRAAR